jgi:hypothetical protein
MIQKVEVDQIWRTKGGGVRWLITKVDLDKKRAECWGRLINGDGSLEEENKFGFLYKDGSPAGWSHEWEMEPSSSQTLMGAAASTNDLDQMMHFFQTSSHPENCQKCGAPKPCAYHPS